VTDLIKMKPTEVRDGMLARIVYDEGNVLRHRAGQLVKVLRAVRDIFAFVETQDGRCLGCLIEYLDPVPEPENPLKKAQ
jgi:hypothetical protein